MHLAKQIASRYIKKDVLKKLLVVALFIVVSCLVHFYYLGTNELNPDAVNWHKRSEQFVLAFKTHDFVKTNQHYHPGVTLMWIIGSSVEFIKQFTNSGTVYNSSNYETFHLASKVALLLANLTLTLFLLYFLGTIIGFWKSFAVVLLMNIEPFFLGNSRVLHMDILFTNLVAVSLTISFYAYKSKKIVFFVLAGFFSALTVLTRSIGVGVLLYSSPFYMYVAWISKSKRFVWLSGVFLVSAIATCFILFPALWVRPVKTVDKIFSRSYQIGVESGHNQIFMNKYTEDPGVTFYLFAILLKVSPFMLLGILLLLVIGFFKLRKSNFKELCYNTVKCQNGLSFTFFLLIFYLGYFLVLNTSNKKVDRYILPLYFLFSYLAVWGYYYLLKIYDKIFVKITVCAFFAISVILPIYKFAPYEFLYHSPLFKTSATANNIISQKNFGMGIYHLKKYIDSRYGCASEATVYPKNFKIVIFGSSHICPQEQQVSIGLSDAKAMREIHGNSSTIDSRFNSPSLYDVLVLAIDEEMPEEALEDNLHYAKDASVFVNDVELWRVYVKKD